MQQHIVWRVEAAFVPNIRRHCPGCGHDTFTSSSLFRLNANGGRIDVWLVYRCAGCSRSYKLTVYERVTPGWLAARGVYDALLANDGALAEKTARDTALLRRNGVAAVSDNEGFTVQGPLPADPDAGYLLAIALPAGLRLRTDTVLARKLGVSRAAVQKRIKKGAILLEDGAGCPKYLRGVTTLRVEPVRP